ncbi:hypothetical protein HYALB_00012788 [Hymenoscyphus albidus]|uniref:Uncharacterized protein n=1 Tax=Hymenoscyphus albidus TaxID=595503 RepID=A0A9N9PZY4_9HELO|nr:hypothetical protein HYALB_00012788 [Hymenoscyphus albidus]
MAPLSLPSIFTTRITSLHARNPHPLPIPTKTTKSLWSRILHVRLVTTPDPSIIPTTYGSINSSLSPGVIVGIVLGSVGGFLLLLWLLYTCLSLGRMGTTAYTEEVVVARPPRRKSHRGSRASRRVTETVEVRRDRTPVRIVREPTPPPPRSPPRTSRRETIIVEERREERRAPSRAPSRRGSDEVVVIEEHSPPRRKKSHRSRDRDRGSRPPPEVESGFRTVDPSGFGGVVGGNRRSGSRRRYG